MPIMKHKQWQDGQGIIPADLNAISDLLRAQFFDLLSALPRLGESQVGIPTGHLLAVGNGGAPWHLAASPMDVQQIAGPIGQVVTGTGYATGGVPAVNWYYAEQNELATTLGAADALPRIDRICVKIDAVDGPLEARHFEDAATREVTSQNLSVTKDTRITKQVVVGVPDAAPVAGAVPAGFVKWCDVLVPGSAVALLPANFTDHRLPAGLHVVDVLAHDALCDPAKWTYSVGAGATPDLDRVATAADSKPILFIPGPPAPETGRLVKVGLVASYAADGTAGRSHRLVRTGAAGSFLVGDDLADLRDTIDGTPYYFEATPSSPVWMNGRGAGLANAMGVPPATAPPIVAGGNRLGLRVYSASDGAGADRVLLARFFIAASQG